MIKQNLERFTLKLLKIIWQYKELLVVCIVSVVLFHVNHENETARRGYKTVAGEHLFFILPVIWFGSKAMWRGMKEVRNHGFQEWD